MINIKEPFEPVHTSGDMHDENGKLIQNYHMSRLAASCYLAYVNDIESPLPITDELSDIFDIGNDTHDEEQTLNKGAINIIACEEDGGYMKIYHTIKKYSISGRMDYEKYDFRGRYIEDLKSAQFKSFYYFLTEPISEDYILQTSGYSYMRYVFKGYYIPEGVLRKIDKENRRNTISRGFILLPKDKMRDFLERHPVINYFLGVINKDTLIDLCVAQMYDKGWKCTNCQYSPKNTGKDSCPVYNAIK